MTFHRVVTIVLALALLAAPLTAAAQQPGRLYRVGYLGGTSLSAYEHNIAAFRDGLRQLGWVEGQNILIDFRWAEGSVSRLPALAAELVRLRVDLIVAAGTPGAQAAKRATRELPIVFGMVSDPVASGIVASLAHPGGNATGWTNILPDLSAKLLQLLKETAPKVSRVVVLWSPTNPGKILEFKETQAAARALGVTLQSFEVRASKDFETAFPAIVKGRADALITFIDALTIVHRQQIVDFAAQQRLPAIYQASEFVQAGGLMSYAPNLENQWRRAATYVDKILKGAKPADLPVEQPMRFELVVNLKTAKALGLTIPRSVLSLADQVIQ